MEFRNLSTFVQVAELNSFTKAAQKLGYNQSTVSFQIRQLEEELNCQLFDRINHTISLTEKGARLLQYAVGLLQQENEFKQSFTRQESPKGHVHIVTPDSICEIMMSHNYNEFYSTYPNIQLEFSTACTDVMFDYLDSNKADVIFTLDEHIYRHDYVTVKEAPVPIHFVTSADSPLAKKNHLTINDLLPYPFLLTERGTSYRRILDQRLAQYSIEITPVLEITRTDVIIGCLKQNVGIAFLPEFVAAKDVAAGNLVNLDVESFDITIWKQLIHHRNKWLSQALLSFLDFVKNHEFDSW